jgi:dCMP deaminase
MTWDEYFYEICKAVSMNSKCLSRQIGALIVRDNSIISTGYNGPPRKIIHCSQKGNTICPRRLLGFDSGQGLDRCPAAHAETNAIANAARLGVSCIGATLYLNCVLPCKNCAASIINAGIIEVVATELQGYDMLGQDMLFQAGIIVRAFEL